MSDFTEDVLQGQGGIFEVLRALPVKEWSLLLFYFIFLWCMTVCCICFSIRQNRASECPAVGVWDVDMPRGPLSPTYGKIKQNTSPNPKLWTWLGKSSIPWRLFLTKKDKKSKDLISSRLDNQMVVETTPNWGENGTLLWDKMKNIFEKSLTWWVTYVSVKIIN